MIQIDIHFHAPCTISYSSEVEMKGRNAKNLTSYFQQK